ncbi:MAG: hypothetical protein RIF34_08795, partial [Candidatus Kapaibacterium sp.]
MSIVALQKNNVLMLFIVVIACCFSTTNAIAQDTDSTKVSIDSTAKDSTADEIYLDVESDLERRVIYSAKDSAIF